jgi:acyl-CoA reductase-like NAD-dependent aldehyde dehydrogenase
VGSPALSHGVDPAPVVDTARAAAARWRSLPLYEKARLLRGCIRGVVRNARTWTERACREAGIDPGAPLSGEPLLSGPVVSVRFLRILAEGLERGGVPPHGGLGGAPGGRVTARVLPLSVWDRILYRGVHGSVWMQPGLPASQGADGRDGGVALVLGAGNIQSIPVFDAIEQLVVRNRVVILKMNPLVSWLTPILRDALWPLVEPGYLAIVDGDARTADAFVRHPAVDAIHLTGSHKTYDAIVWGAQPEERSRRKASGSPRVDKPFTAELGSVTPVLVVPGAWSAGDLRRQAENLASMVAHNASFNCTSAKVAVVASRWPQKDAFLRELRAAFRAIPPRVAYYPGAFARHAAVVRTYPRAEGVGEPAADALPWTLLPEVPAHPGEYALTEEAFCSVLALCELDAATPGEFLPLAVSFANDDVWGTLSCAILVDPASRRLLGPAFEEAVADLRYGAIGINLWPGVIFGLGSTTWGAFPGHRPEDIRSGIGAAHNALGFDHAERSVVEGPFRPWPKPPWFANHRTLRALAEHLLRFEASPSILRLPLLFAAAVRG